MKADAELRDIFAFLADGDDVYGVQVPAFKVGEPDIDEACSHSSARALKVTYEGR